MRIVSVCRVFPTQRPGGMPFVCQDRAEELARQGHDVHVLTTGSDIVPDGYETETLNGVSIHYLPCPKQVYSAEFADQCERACIQMRPDVIHLDSFDRGRVWWAGRPGTPKVVAVTMHGNEVGTQLTKWNLYRAGVDQTVREILFKPLDVERRGLMSADRVLAVSLSEEWQLRDVLALPKTRLVYNPIAPYFGAKPVTPVPPDAPLLCAAVSGHKERGFWLAESVAAKLGRKLVVAKHFSRERMPQVYDECAAVLLPTLYAQGYDLTVAEANARGRAVFATPTGSYLREADGFHLKLVKDLSTEAFVEAMQVSSLVGLPPRWERHRPDYHVRRWLEALGL